MASHTQTEMRSPQHRATAPASPPSEKKGLGFFRRHLGHRRRSSVTFPNGHSTSPQVAHPPVLANNGTRKASLSSSNHEIEKPTSKGTDGTNDTNGTDETNETDDTKETSVSIDEPEDVSQQDSKSGGVKWAAGYSDGRSNRPRRTSSTGTTGTTGTSKRYSIYVRGAKGDYMEGVDAGVGSKARRLSVQMPEQLQTDECPLSEHFSIFARAGKKDIGEGGAAVVRLMQSKTAGTGKDKVFAVKEFREWDSAEETESDYVRKIKSEYAIAKSLHHPNIVDTYRLCFADNKWFHVMEYCDLGDLNDIINKGFFSGEDRNCMFKQLLRGVDYIHSRGIAHRDLKSENLLLTKSGCLKIADFGTAEVFSGTHPGLKHCRRQSMIDEDAEIRFCKPGMVGSKPYMAPEIIDHKADYDPRGVDVWSCAIVYLTLCLGGTPWECASTTINNYNIYCNTWDDWKAKYPDGIIKEGRPLPGFASTRQFQQLADPATKRMIMGMLHPDPTKRWSAQDALNTKTVTESPCCQQEGYSDDIKTRQRKVLHNHVPPKLQKSKSNKLHK